MVSKLANEYFEKWKSEGLNPTLADLIMINDLGLAVENGSDMFSFSACPRYAVLNDVILKEPIIAKRIWLEECLEYFSDDVTTKIFFIAYVLGTPDDELPNSQDIKKILKEAKKFRDNVLLKCTETQILAAITWVLNGFNTDYSDLPEKEKKAVEETFKLPEQHSVAKQLLLQAISSGINKEDAEACLYEDLEKMVMAAALEKGVDILKNENMKYAGRLYQAAGKIYKRLTEERQKENGQI